ncbi:MAG: hypothetical protein ABH804_00455 [archaeon]
MINRNLKKAQEEIIGFVLIIILVSVILLIFLLFSLKTSQKEPVESYEVENFLQAMLQYTTECESYTGFFSVQNLIVKCYEDYICLNGKNACDALETTLSEMIEESWKVGEDRTAKGYMMNITAENKQIISLKNGNVTGNSRGAVQFLGARSAEVYFVVYS